MKSITLLLFILFFLSTHSVFSGVKYELQGGQSFVEFFEETLKKYIIVTQCDGKRRSTPAIFIGVEEGTLIYREKFTNGEKSEVKRVTILSTTYNISDDHEDYVDAPPKQK